jgi:hypothetical protein
MFSERTDPVIQLVSDVQEMTPWLDRCSDC